MGKATQVRNGWSYCTT